jgi:hypothetical protein
MSLRIFSAGLILLAAGCTREPATENVFETVAAADRIECAVGEGAAMTNSCALERGEGNVLVLRHADGGFRKLTLDPDGTIDTADGADGLELKSMPDGRTEVVIGLDKYRLPAGL